MATPNEAWLESARKYITTEECDCDCFLCMRGEHDEHCEWDIEDEILIPLSYGNPDLARDIARGK